MSSFSLAEALKKSRPQRPGQLQSPPRVLTMRNSHSEPAHMTMRRRNDEVVSIPTRPWHSPSRDQGAATLSNLSPSFSLDPPNFLRNLQRQCQMSRSFAQQKLSLASIIGGAMLQPSDCDESKSAGTLAGISDTISLDASVSHHFLCERSARIGRSGNCSNSTHRNWLSRRLGGSKRRRRHRRLDCNIQGNGDREGCGGWLQVPDIQALDDRKPCKAARSPQKPLPAQMQMLHQRQQQQQQIVKCATMLGGGQYHCGGGAQHYIRSTNISGQSANSNCLADQRSPSRHSDRNELEFGREDLKVCGHWQESLSNDDQNTTEASGTEDENRTRMAGVGSDLSSLTLSRMELSSSQAAATEQHLLQQQQQLQLQQRPRRFGGVDIGCTTTPASTGASEVTSSRSQQRQLQHQQQQFVLQQLQNAQQVQQRQGHHVVLPNVLEPHQLIAAQQLMVGVNYDQQQLNQQQLNQQQHQQQQLNQQQLNQQQYQQQQLNQQQLNQQQLNQQQLNQQQLNQQQLNQQQLNQQQLNQQQQYQQYQLMQQSSSMYQDHSKGMTMTNQLHWQHQQPSNLQQYVPPNQQQQATQLPDQLPDELPKRSRQHHLLQQQQHQHYQRHPHHLGVGRSSRHPAVGMNSSSSSYSLSQSQRSTRESNSGRDEEAIPASDDLVHLSVISCTEGGDGGGGGGGGGVGGGGTSEAEATTTPAAETEGEGEAGTTLCAESDDHRVPCSVVSTDQRNQQQQLQQQQQQQQQLDKQPKHQQQPQEQHQHQQQPKSERLLSAAESQRSSRYGRLKTPEICKRDFLSMLRQNISHGRLNRRAKMKLSGRL